MTHRIYHCGLIVIYLGSSNIFYSLQSQLRRKRHNGRASTLDHRFEQQCNISNREGFSEKYVAIPSDLKNHYPPL